VNPHSHVHPIVDKGTQNIQWRKGNLPNKCCWENWISAFRKLKVDPCLSFFISINSKWIWIFIRPETLKLVQERAEDRLGITGIGNLVLNRTQMAQN
jgi:hypothetical protein